MLPAGVWEPGKWGVCETPTGLAEGDRTIHNPKSKIQNPKSKQPDESSEALKRKKDEVHGIFLRNDRIVAD